jgi:seryl-tRNA synthetase
MLQVSVIKNNLEMVKELLGVKNFKSLHLVDTILELDEERKKIQLEFDTTQAKINQASKQIGQLMAAGNATEANQLKTEVANYKLLTTQCNNDLVETEKKLHDTLVQLPNLPSAKVPKGTKPEDNITVKQAGNIPVLHANAKPHWDLIKEYNLVDFETGAKIAGSGFPLYKGKGAKLQRALSSFFLDCNIDAGYQEFIPPYLVNEASAYGTGQLPDKEGQMYCATADNLYLIPTAEVPVTNIYRDTILKEEELPIKMTAYSPCFRREAGSFGKDVRGLNRVHQFEKVEIIQIVHPNNSYQTLDAMVLHVENILIKLQLPYRILALCGGDMSFASALTYDFEVYSAAQEKWLEVSSVSNFESFQTNRMKCRFKNAEGKTQFAHSLNGSSLALPRIYAAIVENYQTENNIEIPEVLQPYFGAKSIEK